MTAALAVPEVETTAGRVRGRLEAGVAVFRGIPYAEPPIGPRRFTAPVPARSWAGVREAFAFGPPPPQVGSSESDASQADSSWLTVNVWTPDCAADAGRPVMVWIPGGAYAIGASGLPEYDGARLAGAGVVLVTLNYRLGIEGFAHLDGAVDNRGLLDQVAALEWVRDNIAAFGGDPDRVTVFGESAGGGSVAALLAMPRAAGLFRRAIAQSVPGVFFSPDLAADVARALAGELGLPPTIDTLRDVPPERLPAVAQTVSARMDRWATRWGPICYRPIPFAPVVDGDVLPVAPWAALADGASSDVDLLVGHTRDEHRLFSLIDGVLGRVTPDMAEQALIALAPDPRGYRQAFPNAGPEQLYELVNSDWLFRMPTQHLARAHQGRSYLYELAWPAPGLGGALGACHGLDVPLVFGNLTNGQPAMLIGEAVAEAEQVSSEMRSAWLSFAADGEPGWPAYAEDQQLTRIFDAASAVVPYPEESSRLLWRDHTFGALPLTS